MIDLVQCFYYWSDHQATIQQYIWNCYVYQWSKASQDDTNDLLQPLLISQQRWQDIIINFIIELSLLKNYNVICMIICHLFKEHCYDSSYASMLIAMLITMLMTIVGRSPLGYRVVSRSILFRVSLCSSESYR